MSSHGNRKTIFIPPHVTITVASGANAESTPGEAHELDIERDVLTTLESDHARVPPMRSIVIHGGIGSGKSTIVAKTIETWRARGGASHREDGHDVSSLQPVLAWTTSELAREIEHAHSPATREDVIRYRLEEFQTFVSSHSYSTQSSSSTGTDTVSWPEKVFVWSGLDQALLTTATDAPMNRLLVSVLDIVRTSSDSVSAATVADGSTRFVDSKLPLDSYSPPRVLALFTVNRNPRTVVKATLPSVQSPVTVHPHISWLYRASVFLHIQPLSCLHIWRVICEYYAQRLLESNQAEQSGAPPSPDADSAVARVAKPLAPMVLEWISFACSGDLRQALLWVDISAQLHARQSPRNDAEYDDDNGGGHDTVAHIHSIGATASMLEWIKEFLPMPFECVWSAQHVRTEQNRHDALVSTHLVSKDKHIVSCSWIHSTASRSHLIDTVAFSHMGDAIAWLTRMRLMYQFTSYCDMLNRVRTHYRSALNPISCPRDYAILQCLAGIAHNQVYTHEGKQIEERVRVEKGKLKSSSLQPDTEERASGSYESLSTSPFTRNHPESESGALLILLSLLYPSVER